MDHNDTNVLMHPNDIILDTLEMPFSLHESASKLLEIMFSIANYHHAVQQFAIRYTVSKAFNLCSSIAFSVFKCSLSSVL